MIYSEKRRVDVFVLPIATIIFCIVGDYLDQLSLTIT